jgi:hypothetical protein
MPPAGFESEIPARERLHTIAIDRAPTEIGTIFSVRLLIKEFRCVTKGRCTSGNLDISTQMARDADEVAI